MPNVKDVNDANNIINENKILKQQVQKFKEAFEKWTKYRDAVKQVVNAIEAQSRMLENRVNFLMAVIRQDFGSRGVENYIEWLEKNDFAGFKNTKNNCICTIESCFVRCGGKDVVESCAPYKIETQKPKPEKPFRGKVVLFDGYKNKKLN